MPRADLVHEGGGVTGLGVGAREKTDLVDRGRAAAAEFLRSRETRSR